MVCTKKLTFTQIRKTLTNPTVCMSKGVSVWFKGSVDLAGPGWISGVVASNSSHDRSVVVVDKLGTERTVKLEDCLQQDEGPPVAVGA